MSRCIQNYFPGIARFHCQGQVRSRNGAQNDFQNLQFKLYILPKKGLCSYEDKPWPDRSIITRDRASGRGDDSVESRREPTTPSPLVLHPWHVDTCKNTSYRGSHAIVLYRNRPRHMALLCEWHYTVSAKTQLFTVNHLQLCLV